MFNFIKGLLAELFVSPPAIVIKEVVVPTVVEEIKAAVIVVEEIKAAVVEKVKTTKQRAGTVAKVKLEPLAVAPVKKAGKPYHSKKKATTKPSK
jgi:hypothetical protein